MIAIRNKDGGNIYSAEAVDKTGLAALAALWSYITSSIDILLWLFLIFASLDFITGSIAAWRRPENNWMQDKAIVGIIKKFGCIIVIFTAIVLDFVLIEVVGFYDTKAIYLAITCWYIAEEMLSLIKNLDDLGTDLPPFLRQIIEKFKFITKRNIDIDDKLN